MFKCGKDSKFIEMEKMLNKHIQIESIIKSKIKDSLFKNILLNNFEKQ